MKQTGTGNETLSRGTFIALFLIVFGTYITFSPAHFLTTPDERINLRTTLSLLEGQWGAIPTYAEGFASKTGMDGREYAQYGLGLPILSTPWLLLGLWIDPSNDTSANQLANVDEMNFAGTRFLRWWITLFTMVLSAMTTILFAAILRRLGMRETVAVFFALLLAFCTYQWPHGRTFFTEPLTAFCLMGVIWSFLQARARPDESRWIVWAGVFWAYALLTRVDTVFTAPAALWFLFVRREETQFRLYVNWKRTLLFSVPFLAVIAIIGLYNYYRFGSPFSTGYEDQAEKVRFITPLLTGLHGFLFTPGRSLFLYSPPLIFTAWGAWRLWKRDPWFTGGLVCLCGCYLVFMSKWQNWAGGYDWGPRHIYQITPILMILASSFFLDRELFDRSTKRIGWGLFISLSVFIQFLGLAVDAVMTVHRTLQYWPPNQHQFIMKFIIYLPHFSNPALHWKYIFLDGPDLLIFRMAQDQNLITLLFLVPIGMVVVGAVYLWRERTIPFAGKN